MNRKLPGILPQCFIKLKETCFLLRLLIYCCSKTIFSFFRTEVLNQKLSLDSLSRMKNLKELRLKSFLGLHLTDSLKSLTDLSDTLTTLSLTSVKNLGSCKLHFIGKLQNLEALELGECSDLPETFPHEVIAKLTTLKRWVLCALFGISEAYFCLFFAAIVRISFIVKISPTGLPHFYLSDHWYYFYCLVVGYD